MYKNNFQKTIIFLLCVILFFSFPQLVLTTEAAESINTSRYYYNQLNKIEKTIYDALLDQMYGNATVSISKTGSYTTLQWEDMIWRAERALLADQPLYSMYWTSNIKHDFSGKLIVLERTRVDAPDYLISTALARAEQYTASIDSTADRFTQLYELYKILYNETYYDGFSFLEGSNSTASYAHSMLGCLGYGLAVCDGFAYSVKMICDNLNIPCIYVAAHSIGATIGHAWNYIQMENGQWYNFDASERFGLDLNFLTGIDAVCIEEDMLNGELGDFTFPQLAEQSYSYSGIITNHTYTLAPNKFLDAPGTFVYEVNEDKKTCTITGYYGAQQGDLKIPDKINGYTVTAIGPAAFLGCIHFKGSIIIPDTVTTIEDHAFRQCYGISGVLKLPKNLVHIGAGAFEGNINMTGTLELPDTLRYLGHEAFFCCEKLTGSVKLPEGLVEVSYPFYDCTGLNGTLYIPNSLETVKGLISGTNFKEFHIDKSNPHYSVCDGILYSKDMTVLIACPSGKKGNITIPKGVLRIENSACSGCEGLTGDLILPEGLESIGSWAFALTSFTGDLIIPDSVTSIGSSAFYSSRFDGNLKLPANITRIEESAFGWCSLKGTLCIPETVTYIGDYAFEGNSFEGHIVIPKNVEHLGGYLIGTKTTGVTFMGDAPQINFQAFNGVKISVYYPKGSSGWSQVISQEFDSPGLTWIASDMLISQHPVSQIVAEGEKVKVTVRAVGKGLSYQWYFAEKGSKKFTLTTAFTGNSYYITMNEARDGRRVYCVVTDQNGNKMKSNIATLSMIPPLKIVEQPKNAYAIYGDEAKTTVKASGDGLTYQWYVKNAGASSYTKSSIKTATYSCKMSDTTGGRYVKCKITDKYGNVVWTNTVRLKMKELAITTQPTTQKVKAGKTATFKVVPNGKNVTYQWQYKTSSTGSWKNISAANSKTANYSLTAENRHNGYYYRCRVTDSAGNRVYTKTVRLFVLAIKTQPTTQKVKAGATAKFTVSAIGNGLKYQWQYKTSSTGSWKNISAANSKTANYSLTAENRHNGYYYRCRVTDSAGNRVYTKTVRLFVLGIKTQPVSRTVEAGKTAKFTVSAIGNGLKYQWQYRTSSTGSWQNISADSAKTASYSLITVARHNGYQYRCKITDSAGNVVYTNIVKLTVK